MGHPTEMTHYTWKCHPAVSKGKIPLKLFVDYLTDSQQGNKRFQISEVRFWLEYKAKNRQF